MTGAAKDGGGFFLLCGFFFFLLLREEARGCRVGLTGFEDADMSKYYRFGISDDVRGATKGGDGLLSSFTG